MTFQSRWRNRAFTLLAAVVLCLSHAGPASSQEVLGSNVNVLVAWDASDHLLLLVQEKLFNYLTFVADGELARRHPAAARQWRVVVDCRSEPDARMRTLFTEAAAQFRSLGGSLDVRVTPASTAGD